MIILFYFSFVGNVKCFEQDLNRIKSNLVGILLMLFYLISSDRPGEMSKIRRKFNSFRTSSDNVTMATNYK